MLSQSDAFLRNTYNRYLLPTILSVLSGTVNVFFDGILIGQKLGADGLSAVSLCMPFYLLLCTVGALVAAGSCMLSSQKIGKNDQDAANAIYNNGLFLILVLGAIITVLGVVCIDGITALFSGSSGLFDLVRAYLLVIVIGTLPKLLIYIPFYYLRLVGKSKHNTIALVTMTLLNILLDYLCLFVWNLGIGGAAWASVIASTVAVAIAFVPLFMKDSTFIMTPKKIDLSHTAEIVKIGSPSGANNLMSALRVLVLNAILLAFGGSPMVAVFAVVNSVSEFSLCIISGIPQTASSLMGVLNEEKSYSSIRILMRRQLISGLVLVGIFAALIVAFPNAIGGLFGVTDVSLLSPLGALALSLFFSLINSVMTVYYNINGQIGLANLITTLRTFVFATLFAFVFGYGNQDFIWAFLPASEVAAMAVWFLIAWRIKGKDDKYDTVLLQDNTLEKSGKVLDFSIESTPENICYASEQINEFCEQNEMDPGTIMRISLSMEEIMVLCAAKSYGQQPGETFDVRVFFISGTIGIRIRYAGKLFDPMTDRGEDDDMEFMGMDMIETLAELIIYKNTFGINSLLILV